MGAACFLGPISGGEERDWAQRHKDDTEAALSLNVEQRGWPCGFREIVQCA